MAQEDLWVNAWAEWRKQVREFSDWMDQLRQKLFEQCGMPSRMFHGESNMSDIKRCTCEPCRGCYKKNLEASAISFCTCDTPGHDAHCASNRCPICKKTCRAYIPYAEADADATGKKIKLNVAFEKDGAPVKDVTTKDVKLNVKEDAPPEATICA